MKLFFFFFFFSSRRRHTRLTCDWSSDVCSSDLAGHLGAKDGYATFEPTEFKVGDLNIPVSLVNDALQKKLLEQRDRLKLPEFVSDVRVENGELIVKQK